MKAAFEQWICFQTGLAPTSADTYRSNAAHFINWLEEKELELGFILPEHMAAYIADAQADNCTNVIKGRINMLRTFFEWAVHQKLMAANPVNRALLPKLRRSKPDKVPFTYGQYQQVLAEVTNSESDWPGWWAPAVRIGWHTGLRCSDVAHLSWPQIDFTARLITVRPIKKKAVNEVLEIPMEPELLTLLVEIEREHDDWVLPRMRWRYDEDRESLPKEFRRICDAVGLTKHSFHSFRHGFVTRLLNAGVDPVTIGSMTGQTIQQISEYAHISSTAKAAALERSRQAMLQSNQPQLKIA